MRLNYNIDNIKVDPERLKKLQDQVMLDFTNVTAAYGNDFCIGYSGGKDSVVVSYFATLFGIVHGACDASFCFPKDVVEMKEIASRLGLKVVFDSFLDDDWLLMNPKYIFPKGKDSSAFYGKRQQRTIIHHAKKHTGLITGRRHQENMVKSKVYKTKNGLINFHPIADWSSVDVWGFVKWKNLPLLSIYNTALGLQEGATPWCNISRTKTPNEDDCWKLIYDHDPIFFTTFLSKKYPQAKSWNERFL